MAENHQRIHPANDLESQTNKPTAPLVPSNIAKSDSRDHVPQDYPPPPSSSSPPPLPNRTLPVTHSNPPKKRRSCCCRFFCWTFSILLFLIIAIAIAAGILFLVFRPKLPKYSVDRLRITQFNLSENNNLVVNFNVVVTARNPNKKIGIYYVGGSRISSWYEDTNLCEGSLPKFYQGHRNTTVLNLPLSGETQDGAGLVSGVQQELQERGNIPLVIRVNQPVRVKVGRLKLFRVRFRVRCRIVVDSFDVNSDIRVSDSSCKFRLRI